MEKRGSAYKYNGQTPPNGLQFSPDSSHRYSAAHFGERETRSKSRRRNRWAALLSFAIYLLSLALTVETAGIAHQIAWRIGVVSAVIVGVSLSREILTWDR
jgi:hypothetical protein